VKLYVMRHGPAEDDAPSGLDSDRALSEAGRKRVRSVARALLDIDEAPLQVVSSPLVRAVQTAEIIAIVTKLDERPGTVEIHRELSPGGDAVALARAFASEGRRRVMLVGHEPDLSGLVSSLLGLLGLAGPAGTFDRPFDKAMVVGLQLRANDAASARLPASAARLRFVFDPKTLRLDPDARGPGN
jgi:phosphohistidine phosphatase